MSQYLRRVAPVLTAALVVAGAPLLGFVGNHVGTLDSLYVVMGAMVPAALLVIAVRKPRRGAT
jgi:hypothetical protein